MNRDEQIVWQLRHEAHRLKQAIARGKNLRPHGHAVECKCLVGGVIDRLQELADDIELTAWRSACSGLAG